MKLSANSTLSGSISRSLKTREAPDVPPNKVSPTVKSPLTEATSKTFVVPFQVLTLAVTPLVCPVTISLNTNVPVDVREGSENVMLTTSLVVYPEPALVNPKKVTIPALLISATAVAVVPTPVGPEIVTVGLVVNPPPWLVNVTTPSVPSPVKEVAAAPDPSDPPPKNLIPGPAVYPAPGLVIGTD